MKVVPVTRQNVTVASKATKVTLRLCRGECHNDKNLGHVDDDGDRKKGDKESADAHGFFGALKYDVQVDANGPLGYGTDGAELAAASGVSAPGRDPPDTAPAAAAPSSASSTSGA